MPERKQSERCWRKSSHSGTGNCVEVAFVDGMVHIRDSRDPDGSVLSVAPAGWEEFMKGIGSGRFRIR